MNMMRSNSSLSNSPGPILMAYGFRDSRNAARIIVVGQGYVAAGQTVEPVFAQSDTALAESARSADQMK